MSSLCVCSDLYAYTEHTDQELMRALSVRIRNWCAPWPYASVPYAHSQHVHQFSRFSNVDFVYPQQRVRNWCVHWACASETDAYTEQTCQEPIRALSIYASGTGTCTEHMRQELMRALNGVNAVWNLKRSLPNVLRIRVKSWCVPWAVASGTDVFAQHTRQGCSFFDHWHFLKFCLFFEQQD